MEGVKTDLTFDPRGVPSPLRALPGPGRLANRDIVRRACQMGRGLNRGPVGQG